MGQVAGRKEPRYSRPLEGLFTCPAFEASGEQLHNMQRLSNILHARIAASRPGDTMELAELYREQGRFGEAEQVISSLGEQDVCVASRLIASLIAEKQAAPMRYLA